MADRFRGPRQTKEWAVIPTGGADMTANGLTLGGALAFTEARTVLRMLGEYVVGATGGGTIAETDNAHITVAIGVVSSDAAAAGFANLPDPFGEPEYPWLYWADHEMLFPSGGDNGTTAQASLRRSFDIRSMRKIKSRESLIFVLEYTDILGTPPITAANALTRVLLGH